MDELERSTPERDEARGKSRTAILILASLLSATVLMAPAAASALVCGFPDPCPTLPGFNISAYASAEIRDISDPNLPTVVASLRVEAPPDQALIDISAPLSLPVGGATLSALATFRSVVIPTSRGGIIAFGTAEATAIIDPLLVTPVVFPVALAGVLLRFDSGDAPVAVSFSGAIHVSGAELDFETGHFVTSGAVLFFRPRASLSGPPNMGCGVNGLQFGCGFINLPTPADIPFAFSGVVKPNSTLNFSIDAEVLFEDPANLSTNFRDSRLDFTFTATPVPGPSPLLLLVGGLPAIALICRRRSATKRTS